MMNLNNLVYNINCKNYTYTKEITLRIKTQASGTINRHLFLQGKRALTIII